MSCSAAFRRIVTPGPEDATPDLTGPPWHSACQPGVYNRLAQGHTANLVVEPGLDPMSSNLGHFTLHCAASFIHVQ